MDQWTNGSIDRSMDEGHGGSADAILGIRPVHPRVRDGPILSFIRSFMR